MKKYAAALAGAVFAVSFAGNAFAKDKIIGVSWSNFQEERWKTDEAAIKAAKPGARASDVDKAARDVITAAGYGPNFLHRTGHGLGIDIHEPPYITATADTVLEDGMVFSIEPGIYLQGQYGLRLEDIVIIRNGQAEILSDMPRTAVVGG